MMALSLLGALISVANSVFGHTNHQNTPQRINPSHFQGKSILSIQAGYGHTLARCADGTLFAWGWNNCGQLGLGHTNEPSTPQQIDPNHFQR